MWQVQHASNVRELQERGVKIPTYMEAPDDLPGVMPWLDAFWELSTDRAYAGGPIPASSISAWPVIPAERTAFRRCIRAADAAYLEHLSKPKDRTVGVADPSVIRGKRK
jgi:hypothetical protein